MLALPHSFLLLPEESSKAFAHTMRKVHLSAIRFLLSDPFISISPSLRRKLQLLRPLLTTILKKNPHRLIKAMSQQDVLTAIRMIQLNIVNADRLFPQLITSLLINLQTLPEDFLWDQPLEQLIDFPNQRILHFSPPAIGLSIGPIGISVRTAERQNIPWTAINTYAIQSHPFHSMTTFCAVSTFDSNPLSMEEAHPDKDGNQSHLGGKTILEWQEMLQQACLLIQETLPEWWNEFPLIMNRFVPVGYHQEKHLSASYAEALGLAYISLHPDPLIMAEAIIHESQHNKLNAVLWLDPVLHNAHSEWTSSPVRPDMRPLLGVLLAAHAFVPVAALHARMKEQQHPFCTNPSFARRYTEVLHNNQQAIETLQEKANPTSIGHKILTGLYQLNHTLQQKKSSY